MENLNFLMTITSQNSKLSFTQKLTSIGINIWMKHFADKLDTGRFVRILFGECCNKKDTIQSIVWVVWKHMLHYILGGFFILKKNLWHGHYNELLRGIKIQCQHSKNVQPITYCKLESPIFKGCLCRTKDDCIPLHNIVIARCPTHSGRRILLCRIKVYLNNVTLGLLSSAAVINRVWNNIYLH